MDELELLRDFRHDTPPAQPDAKATARALLQTRMSATPVPRHTPRRRWVLGSVPLTIGAVALAVALVLNPWASQQHDARAAAAQFNALAAKAVELKRTTAPLTDGQFVYTKSESVWTTSAPTASGTFAMALVPRTREIWIGADGSGRIHQEITGPPVWLGQPDPALADSIASQADEDWTFGPGEMANTDDMFGLTPERMTALAADPAALAALIGERAAHAGPTPDVESFVIVGDLLRESNLSPEFRAAIYRYAAGIPRVELLGTLTDNAGRSGVAVAQEYRGVRHELIFDADTAQLLEERDVIVSDDSDYDAPLGTVVGRATYLSSGVVSSTDTTP
jgi:hypothetical protein